MGKPQGTFCKAGVEPKRKLAEFVYQAMLLLSVGDEITVDHFVKGQRIDVIGTSVGKGVCRCYETLELFR